MSNSNSENHFNDHNRRSKSFRLKDIILVALLIVLTIIISVKSMYFDAYQFDETEDGSKTVSFIQTNYDGFVYETGIIKVRVIQYKETEKGTNLRLRRYFIGLFPMGDIYTDF